jgi:hypothetical protein
MAVQSGDEAGRRLADIVHAALAPLGITVQPVTVGDVGDALRRAGARIQLAALSTALDYPDPGSFLSEMLGKDVPTAWLSASTRNGVARLARLSEAARDREAVALASRLSTRDVPVVAYGTRILGTLVSPHLGCRIWNGVDPALDLSALCLKAP